MSKIGRKPIDISGLTVDIQGNDISFKGKKMAGSYTLPDLLKAEIVDSQLLIQAVRKTSDTNRVWGLHRALLANQIIGAHAGFDRQIRIVGLGYKAVAQAGKLQFSLGYSHKIDFDLPAAVTVEIDKVGQLLTCRSSDKELLGLVCSKIRALRPPEPYKGTGIQYVGEVIRRKAGKAKST
jgi:large subunit ribosomal protein L6